MKGGEKVTDFNEIYELYFKDVFKYVITLTKDEHVAEEITQETFFKALKSIHTFKGESKLYVWLCQIAKNTYFTYLEKEKKKQRILEEPFEDKPLIWLKEETFDVHKIIHELDEPYKEVFMLRVFGELPFSQIGLLFQKTESWARVTFHRSKIKIKERMK